MKNFPLFIFVMMPFLLFANQTLIDLPADSWYQVSNTKMQAVCDSKNSSYECRANMTAWSGGAYDPVEHRLLIWGGGHGDGDDNSLYGFDVNSMSWSQLTSHTGSYASQDPLSNGDPASRHTYDGVEFIVHANRFFGYGGSQAGNGFGTSRTWTLNIGSKNWSNLQPSGTHGPTTNCCNFSSGYDPISGLLFMRDPNSLYSYDFDNNEWKGLLGESHSWGAGKGVVDTKRRLYITIGSGEFLVYDIANKKKVTSEWSTSGGSSPIGSSYAAAGYDSKGDRLVAWTGGGPWVLNLDTKQWSRKSGSGAPSSGLSNGTFGRFRYIPEYNVFILVNGVDQDVYFYKHTSGGGTVGTTSGLPLARKGLKMVALPNPFRGSIKIQVTGVTNQDLTNGSLGIYNTRGQRVGNLGLGQSHFSWSPTGLPNGMYLLKAKISSHILTKKVLYQK